MKHHATNFGLFVLLLALLAVPLTGFYMFNYQTVAESNYSVPEYIPINVIGGSEVLSEVDTRFDVDTLETSIELDPTIENTVEFDPSSYIPAN